MTPTRRVRARALELGAIDAQAADVAGAVAGADVVFVATPVGALGETVRLALDSAGRATASSATSARPSARSPTPAADERFVGGHPLAGAETAGVEHAREDLFDGATWYLTPAKGSTAGVLYERLHRLLSRFGARPDGDRRRDPRPADGVRLAPAARARQPARRAGGSAAGRGVPAAARGRPELPRRDPRGGRQHARSGPTSTCPTATR